MPKECMLNCFYLTSDSDGNGKFHGLLIYYVKFISFLLFGREIKDTSPLPFCSEAHRRVLPSC